MIKRRFVVDSSVMVKWVNDIDEKYVENARKLWSDNLVIIAPELAKYEVGNVLLKKKLKPIEFKEALSVFWQIPVKYMQLKEAEALRICEISQEEGITYYDAVFVELSERLNLTLITDNPKHQKKFKGVKVISLADY